MHVLTDTVVDDSDQQLPPATDTDGDGLPDANDACATVAANTPNGCPAATPPSAGAYSTGFDRTENPIGEGGMWVQHGGVTGINWTSIQTANGLAFSTQTSFDGYDDSIALLSGFAADQKVTITVHRNMSAARSNSHEIHAILRGNFAAAQPEAVRMQLGYSSSGFYTQIFRLDGPPGALHDRSAIPCSTTSPSTTATSSPARFAATSSPRSSMAS